MNTDVNFFEPARLAGGTPALHKNAAFFRAYNETRNKPTLLNVQ
jgi:hypothetical protein